MPDQLPMPTPAVVLDARVRTERYRVIVPVQRPMMCEVGWADVTAAAVMAMANAVEAFRARGLPQPKLRDCTWRGCMIVPDDEP